ncbi:MAG: hypothetical protein AAFX44_10025 [Pseudomonadota bacterium]
MNRLVAATAVVVTLLVSPLVTAQEIDPAVIEQHMANTRERLSLSDAQVEQMAPIIEKSVAEQQEILLKYGVDPSNPGGASTSIGFRKARSMRHELEAVRETTVRSLEGILTAEQLAEFNLMQEERRAEMRKRMTAAR